VMREAEALGVPVEEDQRVYGNVFKWKKINSLAWSSIKTELMVRAKDLSSNPNVDGKSREELSKNMENTSKKNLMSLDRNLRRKKAKQKRL